MLNALVQLQARYHHRGEAASEKCLSAATFVRLRARECNIVRRDEQLLLHCTAKHLLYCRARIVWLAAVFERPWRFVNVVKAEGLDLPRIPTNEHTNDAIGHRGRNIEV
jgi:hypothetical protein